MFFLLQVIPTEPPGSFEALQWVMVGMLTFALVYVFRQCQIERRNCVQKDRETIERLLEALENHVHDGHIDITDAD